MRNLWSPSTSMLRKSVLIVVFALLLSGCYRTDDNAARPIAASTSAATPSTVDATGADGTAVETLSEYLGYDYTSAQASAAYFDDLSQQSDEIVAACMRQQGFEYIPNVIEELTYFTYHETDLVDFSDEWIAAYGFGVSTLRWSQDEVGVDLVGYPGPTRGDQNAADPNAEYLDSLSDAQRDAWNLALFGPPLNPDSDSPVQAGCFDQGYEQTFAKSNALWETFGDELATMYDRIVADPRVVHRHQQVNSCVAEAGFDWDSSKEAWEHFEPKLRDIGGEPEFSLDEDDVAALSEAELNELLDGPFGLSDADKSRLAEVQAEELALAQVVSDCGGFDNDGVLAQIYAEHEQQFVDQNRGELALLPTA